MRTIEHELRDLYPLDWQPSSLRPHGFELFTAGLARRGLVTVQGARAGAVLVVKAEVVSASLRHYFVCVADAHGAGMVASGPNLAEELRTAAKSHEGIRAALAAPPKPARFERLPTPSDGENLTQYLMRFCDEVRDELQAVSPSDAVPRLRDHLLARIVECGVRGLWFTSRNGMVPIAGHGAPSLPFACRALDDGDIRVGAPEVIRAIRGEGEFTAWRHSKYPLPPPSAQFAHLAGLLADHGGVLSVERDEDGKLCVRVSFAKDGVAFAQAGDGTLLGNVVEAVGCHVGVECPKEGEG